MILTLARVRKAVANPRLTIQYFRDRLAVRKVVIDREVFYKYKGELYPGYLNEGNAKSFIEEKARSYCTGKGLDIGAGKWPLANSVPIDDEPSQNACKLDNFPDESLDYIFSSHCLEHLDEWQIALQLWIRKLKKDGILFLYLPHKSQKLWLPGSPWVGRSHKWIPTVEILTEFLTDNQMMVIEANPQKDEYWSFHLVARKL